MRRKTAEQLEASGAFDKNPGRRRVDPVSKGELGDAPEYFETEKVEIWKELKENLPDNLVKSADRFIFEIVVRLMHKFRSPNGCNSSETAQLINALAKLGCSPADRTKCSVPVERKLEENQFAEFV